MSASRDYTEGQKDADEATNEKAEQDEGLQRPQTVAKQARSGSKSRHAECGDRKAGGGPNARQQGKQAPPQEKNSKRRETERRRRGEQAGGDVNRTEKAQARRKNIGHVQQDKTQQASNSISAPRVKGKRQNKHSSSEDRDIG